MPNCSLRDKSSVIYVNECAYWMSVVLESTIRQVIKISFLVTRVSHLFLRPNFIVNFATYVRIYGNYY